MHSNTVRGAMRGLLALLVTAGSALVGQAYVTHLHATPVLSERARLVPYAWLLGALLGLVLALRTLRWGPWHRRGTLALALGVIGVLLALPNLAQAALYTVGVMLGD